VLLLALETSSRVGSVTLCRDAAILDEKTYAHGLQHAAALVPLVDGMLAAHAHRPADLSHVAVSIGPGSFTGLRVGVTFAKTLAFATGAKIVAVPTVDAIAANLPADSTQAIVVLDAKRGHIFTARFSRPEPDAAWTCTEPARLDTLRSMLARTSGSVHLIGEGIPFHRDQIEDESRIKIVDESLWTPRASSVARLAILRVERGEFVDPLKFEPIYVRLPEAEEKRLLAEGKLGTLP
jgi:tRNA threonylcarbamoyladenosine biosynthesis protein TsaB